MKFQYESDFEENLIMVLSEKGWEKTVIKNPTEQDLIRNWAAILYNNNRDIDRLNNYPLTDGEMQQIIEQIIELRTPLKLNGFINGRTISIRRDNPEDREHYGKEISLKIYDRHEIAAGQSRYQIAQQPVFTTKSKMLNNRRGDLLLLINGMPVIHIELKRSDIPVSQAYNQIEKYSHEGVFSGLFSLVQIFVAMTPERTVYFANPGPDGKFNTDYYFHWADFNNEPINNWKDIATSLLSIPMAHQLIGFYTVADDSDGILKVMRSYQYYAANAISDVVAKAKWNDEKQRGGYIWHTTGSGKTMTSFKSAQLISNSRDADKVVFLTDRIELGTQSLKEYRAFADENETVQATEDTYVLISKLKSNAYADTLIVTSIQKMSRIKNEECGLNAHDIEIINRKRIVIIVDEAHRSTFGDMLSDIKATFPNAIFFGFTGTPIFEENSRKNSAQTDIFGNELHRYSIADGIRDKNVLGFDPYKILTFKDKDLREKVALEQAKASSADEAMNDPEKDRIYYRFMNTIPMAGHSGDDGEWMRGIEDYIPNIQYLSEEHQNKVVEDIIDNWDRLSHLGKFHAIFATSSIPEAIDYYRLIKARMPKLKVSCLFDPNISNEDSDYKEYKGSPVAFFKEEGLMEILEDYNTMYGQNFSLATHAGFKKDLSLRLAHKGPYKCIENEPEKQLNLLIVVNQMLTGFDSKWLNTLYLDKVLEYEEIIQAFSRTNRLFGPDKPFGIIRYYRKPHTMEQNVIKAVKLYSGDRPVDLFVDKLPDNLDKLNSLFCEISSLFKNAGIPDFEKLPEEAAVKVRFASLFKDFNMLLEAAKVQGFRWDKQTYDVEKDDDGVAKRTIVVQFDECIFNTLLMRYKELVSDVPGQSDDNTAEVPYDIVGYLTEIDTGVIDAEYMDSRFKKYLRLLNSDGKPEEIKQANEELHKTFATLSQSEQKYANEILKDIEPGYVPEDGKTLRDLITQRHCDAENLQIHRFASAFGLDEEKLREMMSLKLTEQTINDFNRYDDLKKSMDRAKAKSFLESYLNKSLPPFKVNMEADNMIRKFILTGGYEIDLKD